jgi:branched-chain amino acid transport system substrate-binding protein
VSQKAKIPHIAYSGLGPAIEKERKCVMHLAASQDVNARAMLEYAKGINAKKIGVLHDAGFGTVVMAELKRMADSYGVTFIATEKFEFGATDTTAQSAKIKAAQPDAVFVIGITASPFRDLRRLQMTQPIISHFGGSSYEMVSAMGSAAENIIFPEFLIAEDPLPHQKDFVEAYKKEYGSMPKNFEAFAWDGVHALAQALAKAGPDADGDKLCAAIRGPYAGVFGHFDFSADDMNGIRQRDIVYSKLVGGKYTRLPFRAQ